MKNILNDLFELSTRKISQLKKKYKRFLFEDITKSGSKFIGIYGSRGVGKTTLMLQLAKSLEHKEDEILYISCDHPILSDISLFSLVEEFYKYGGKAIFIDEIHEAKNFEQELKSVYDFIDIRVYFSGSSAIKITNPSFARRYAMYHLPILSFREYLELLLDIKLPSYPLEEIFSNHTAIASKIIEILKEQKILKHFNSYLKHGAYPFYFSNRDNFSQMLLDTVNAILYKDLVPIYNLSGEKVVLLKKLLVSICVSEPMELSIEKLAKKISTSKVTLYKYIEYLHKAELLTHIMYEGKRFKSMQKPDKLYLANSNLFNILCLEPKTGSIRESFFISNVLGANLSAYYVNRGDFLINGKYIVEIGGKNKGFEQIKDIPNSFVLADNIEFGFKNKIPLWLFGFLY